MNIEIKHVLLIALLIGLIVIINNGFNVDKGIVPSSDSLEFNQFSEKIKLNKTIYINGYDTYKKDGVIHSIYKLFVVYEIPKFEENISLIRLTTNYDQEISGISKNNRIILFNGIIDRKVNSQNIMSNYYCDNIYCAQSHSKYLVIKYNQEDTLNNKFFFNSNLLNFTNIDSISLDFYEKNSGGLEVVNIFPMVDSTLLFSEFYYNAEGYIKEKELESNIKTYIQVKNEN